MNIHDTIRYQNIGLPDDILRRKLWGDFDGAIRLIDQRLGDEKTSQAMKYCLTFHREILQRYPEDFPYTKEEALAIVQKDIPDFTMEELLSLMDSRDIRWIYVRGEERIFNRFYSSICKAVPGFAQRAQAKLKGVESIPANVENPLNPIMRKMKTDGSLTYRIRVRASVKLSDEQFVPGMFMRAHLPIPAACPQQSDIRIEKIWPENGIIAPEDAAQRTICWEEKLDENHAFMVEYSYLHTAVYHDTENMKGQPTESTCWTYEKAPHIMFTPYIRALAAELTDGVEDPLEKARRFYDFITKNMNYTFMPSYFLMENIAETCARDYNGDCGVFALLFLTLCRCAGIPAQWQSGFTAEPNFCGGHDWIRFYVEPHGWLFADCSYGVSAQRNGNEERRKFYFGNLDPYRMVANRAFAGPFLTGKQHWRADPYDNQVGEMETAEKGLNYDEYDRFKEVISCEQV